MPSLHRSTSLSVLAFALAAGPALAATSVSTATTAPLATSTAGDVTVTDDGSITTASGPAITVDSSNAVSIEGDVTANGGNGATAVSIAPGTTSTVAVGEDATITVTESYVPVDEDGNGIADGAIASASNRYGIHVAAGGAASGSILNEGTITVEGLDSAGIAVDSDYTGNVTNTGTIRVIGDNSVGISTGKVDGDVTVEGSVTVVGAGAKALVVGGDVSGAVTIQGTVAQGVSFTNDDGGTTVLSRTALRTGAPAVEIAGSVAGGIVVAAPPVDLDSTDTDEDDDGVTDSSEGTGTITAYGNSPAIQLGGASDIVVGGGASNSGTYSLAIDGTVTANSYYSNTAAYGLVIGGKGGGVTLTDGIGVTGTLSATTYDDTATALLINQGSTVSSLYNSGSISATISSPGEGTARAIQDLSGTLTTIDNTGYIAVTGSSTDDMAAIDLSANTTGVTIRQYLNAYDADASADYLDTNDVDVDPTVYARIAGNILLGSGNDTIDASTGTITGNTLFGAGDDTLKLSGNAVYTGKVYFGAGTATASLADTAQFVGTMDFASQAATLSLAGSSVYAGDFANAGNLSVTVGSGAKLTGNAAGTISFGNLTVKSGGTLGIYIDTETGTSSLVKVTQATLEDNAKITATFTELGDAEGTYTVLTADTLDIQGTLNGSDTDLPFLYKGSVTSDANNVYLSILRKTTDELGLTRSTAAAWDAVYVATQNDSSLTQSLFQVDDSATLQKQVAGLLPDHAGGVFDAVTRADRLVARRLSDETTVFHEYDLGAWLEPVYWRASKDAGQTAGYKSNGWGVSAGYEWYTPLGNVGVSYAWLSSKVENDGGAGQLDLSQHDIGLFWRKLDGPFAAWARIGGSRLSVDSTRTFTGTIDDADFTYSASGKWHGWLISGLAGASYRFQLSDRVRVKPKLELERFWLRENGYAESADSDAIALTVAGRTSKATTVTPTIGLTYSLGKPTRDGWPLTFQVEAGRREALAGSLGSTTAYFNGGDTYDAGSAFTIRPDGLKGAWVGEASVLGGGYDFTWKLSSRAEQTGSGTDLSARASLSVAF